MTICENCGYEIPEDRIHHADPYTKGVCDTFTIVKDTDGKPMPGRITGWVRKREAVSFEAPKSNDK